MFLYLLKWILFLTDLQERMRVTETELKNRCEELEILRAQEKPAVETEATVEVHIFDPQKKLF